MAQVAGAWQRAAAARAAEAAGGRRRADVWLPLVLLAITAATRAPLLGPAQGEPDTGLFIEGVWRWLSYGPKVGEIYGKNLSPGYYWGLAKLLRGLGTVPAHVPAVMIAASFAAALAAAPLLYLVARRLLEPAAAFWASAVFALGPAWWWLGIEAHPQGPAIACWLASLWLYLKALPGAGPRGQPRVGAAAAMVGALTAALLLRADLVLLFLLYPALLWASSGAAADGQRWLRSEWRAMAWTAGMLAAASALFILLRAFMLQQSFGATNAYTEEQTGGYILHGVEELLRSRAYALKQIVPMVTANGLLVSLAAAAALYLGARRWGWAWARRWVVVWAAASGAAYVFWFLVLGNNIRHVTVLALPLLWAAAEAGRRALGRRGLGLACAALLAADWFVIPPSSNVVLYASANVPASRRDLNARQAEIAAAARRMLAASARPQPAAGAPIPACFLGSYTTPYALSSLLLAAGRLDTETALPVTERAIGMRIGPGWSDVLERDAAGEHWMRFYYMYSEEEWRKLRPGCRAAFSFEYDARGWHQRYLGKEWTNVPLRTVWYPPHPATVAPGARPRTGPAPARAGRR